MKKLLEKPHCKAFFICILLLLSCIDKYIYAQSIDFPPNSSSLINAINIKDTDIKDIYRSIAFEYETNIVVNNDINKRVSVALFNMTVFDAIKTIAEDNELVFQYDNRRFFISSPQILKTPEPLPGIPIVEFSKDKLSIELDNSEISEFVKVLREKTKQNFLLTPGTNGRITGKLLNVELEKGLNNLLGNNGYYLINKDSIYFISRSAYFSSLENSNDLTKRPYWVSAQNNLVTLDVTQADLGRILNDLSNQLNLQLLKLADPNAVVTIKCKDVSLRTAMDYLFKGTEFTYKFENGVYLIGNKTSKGLDETRLAYLNYLRADQVKEKIPASIIQNVHTSISIEHNALVLSGSNENINVVMDFIEKIDQPVPQVLIEALVVDYNLDNIKSFGINAGFGDSTKLTRPDKWFPGIDVTASGKKINSLLSDIGTVSIFGENVDIGKLGKLPDNFYVNIKAMEQNGLANIKSKPILSTLNGHTASLKIGTVQNYIFKEIVPIVNAVNSTFIEKERIEKIEAIISFEITPFVGNNGELTLEIKPNFETPVGSFSPDKDQIPAINTRSFVSTVRLRDGETIVLGGVVQESEINNEAKFPILGDIPILGEFFTDKEKSVRKGELMIYLTPRIFYGDELTMNQSRNK
ncbi:MAG: secretin and TonB N-terminal domain-containing protein [Ignavibacteriales bacterium]|nr:MAG: secretin and TonB N-terminal domain-containing protein [Ignavibacteriales bacterium]